MAAVCAVIAAPAVIGCQSAATSVLVPSSPVVTHAVVTHAAVTHAAVARTASVVARPPAPSAAASTVQPTATASSAATVPVPAPAAPTQAAPAPVAPPAPAPSAASCHPLTSGGNCYRPGEFCREADHGASGIDGDGNQITCSDNDGWRWEAA